MKKIDDPYEIRKLDISQNSYISFVSQSRIPHFMWHYHDYYELFAVLDGRGRWVIGDKTGDFKKGQLFIVGPSLPHSFFSVSMEDVLEEPFFKAVVVMFNMNLTNLPEVAELTPLLQLAGEGGLYESNVDELVFDKLKILPDESGLSGFSSLLDILCDLTQGVSQAKRFAATSRVKNLSKEQVDKLDIIYSYLHKHYRDDIRLEEVAKKACMSISGLCAFFKRSSKTSINSYVHELRISQACKLLLETTIPVTEIAFLIGYQTISSFNRKFKEIQNCSPREYRKLLHL